MSAPKNNKKVLLIGALIVAVLMAAAIGFLVWQVLGFNGKLDKINEENVSLQA